MIKIKEKIISLFIRNKKLVLTKSKLRKKLLIAPKDSREFNNAIKELMEENIICKTKKEKYALNNKFELYVGRFLVKNNEKFVVTNVGKKKVWINISSDNTYNALNKDRVLVKIIKRQNNGELLEGAILLVIRRNSSRIIGTFLEEGNKGIVIPDLEYIDSEICIDKKNYNGAKSYDKVICEVIKTRNDTKCYFYGKVLKVLGMNFQIEDEKNSFISFLNDYGIDDSFPNKVLNQVKKIPTTIDNSELGRRLDLTDEIIFTIDGVDAKDLDDAVSIRREGKNYVLGVHIADVSHYVREGTCLDREAYNRGTSIYLINKVIPMLPYKLSNELCSLNPGEIKLTLSVFMKINANGEVLSYEFKESFIKSKARLNYDMVSDYLEEINKVLVEQFPHVIKSIDIMQELSYILKQKRINEGTLRFIFPESKIYLDKNDNPTQVGVYQKRISNDLIEEFMLICNEVVAKHFSIEDIPFIYRVHEKPNEKKIRDLNENLLKMFNTEIKYEDVSALKYQEVFRIAKNETESMSLNILFLHSMRQAMYSSMSKGHFGLAKRYYCHFTSPIRRYPDLIIHRIIKEYLTSNNSIPVERLNELEDIVKDISKQSSYRERNAQEMEDEYKKMKQVEYMQNHIGEIFEGIVDDVSAMGLTVFLNNGIEGIIRNINLINGKSDKYVYDEIRNSYVNYNLEKITIGSKIQMKLINVNINKNIVEFKFIKNA